VSLVGVGVGGVSLVGGVGVGGGRWWWSVLVGVAGR
jgi:hypothetical protein